ncbi:MAG: molybdate transport system ATP-binding protein [Acidimicrobiaceae bacterium]|jgi:molybdate transport system permease protein
MRRTERAPLLPVAIAAVAVAAFALPLAGLLWRAPWSSAWHPLSSRAALDALKLSLITSLAATAVAIVLGVPLAWVQARVDYRGKRLVRALTTLPMVLPPVVGGVALLFALGRRGIVGSELDRIGVHLPFTTAGAIVAETFVAMPFLVLTLEAAFRSSDRRLEEAARTLGASRGEVFRRVTLPLVRPSLIAGAVLCWARALGEFGATITFAGNLPAKTQTLPLFVYLKFEGSEADAAIVLSLVLVIVSLLVVVGLRDRWLTTR